jgi:HEAT repeat protein
MAKTLHRALSAAVSLMLVLAFAVPAFSEEPQSVKKQIANASTVGELQSLYKDSDNAVIRRETLQALSRVHDREKAGLGKKAGTQQSAQEQEKLVEFLNQGLADQSVSVVKEAIRQIGNLRMEIYSGALADLFHSANRKYPGNQKEIQMEVIAALGKIGGGDARMIFSEVLAQGVANSMTARTLRVIGETGDSSLIDAVKNYATSIEASLQSIPNTPENRPRYGKYQEALALARSVETTLLRK